MLTISVGGIRVSGSMYINMERIVSLNVGACYRSEDGACGWLGVGAWRGVIMHRQPLGILNVPLP
jgi:hypothetical protein